MKKIVVSILLIAMFFNLIQPITVYATDDSKKGFDYESFSENGTVNVTTGTGDNKTTRKETITYSPSGGAVGASLLALMGNIVGFTITSVLSSVITDFDVTEAYMFTIYDAVFNKVKLFNANFLLDIQDDTQIHSQIATTVAEWYYAIRNIAIILSLCVLIYVGIRMALSTVANDKAKYKNMLIGWLQSFVLVFFMHYIILISMIVSQKLLDLLALISSSNAPELKIIKDSFLSCFSKSGWDAVASSLVYWVLVFYQIKFFMLYLKRMLAVAFLIIISPLITVTYPIDKIGDGKAQAFGNWFKEFTVNMIIQPLHALLYIIFIISASEIATRAPLLAAIFFMALSRGEKVIKGIFSARGMKSINSMGKGKKK